MRIPRTSDVDVEDGGVEVAIGGVDVAVVDGGEVAAVDVDVPSTFPLPPDAAAGLENE